MNTDSSKFNKHFPPTALVENPPPLSRKIPICFSPPKILIASQPHTKNIIRFFLDLLLLWSRLPPIMPNTVPSAIPPPARYTGYYAKLAVWLTHSFSVQAFSVSHRMEPSKHFWNVTAHGLRDSLPWDQPCSLPWELVNLLRFCGLDALTREYLLHPSWICCQEKFSCTETLPMFCHQTTWAVCRLFSMPLRCWR